MGGDAFASAPIGLICPISPISPIYCAKFCILNYKTANS